MPGGVSFVYVPAVPGTGYGACLHGILMSNLPLVLISIIAYAICARRSLALRTPRYRYALFALVNLSAFVWLTLLANYDEWIHKPILSLGAGAVLRHIALIGFYVLMVTAAYYLMRRFAKREGWTPWIAFFFPISILVGFRYFPFVWEPAMEKAGVETWVVFATIIGLSYMAFRLSYLVLEVRNGVVEMPTLSEYLGFAFFLPTMVVGPISPFSYHQRSLQTIDQTEVPVGTALLRILVGATKYLFLANLANQLSYSGLLLDGKPHGLFDLGTAAVFYYLYLFCNFSGFCDMAIGLGALVGIRVKENFDNPFIARNVKEFWNRWHITLSEYTKDVVFGPVSKTAIRILGPKHANAGIALGILAVFLVIGIWHGVAVHYIVFGLIHAAGVASNHFYTVWMKRKLGKERYKAYNENPYVNAAAMAATFIFVAASFAVFANDLSSLKAIYANTVFGF